MRKQGASGAASDGFGGERGAVLFAEHAGLAVGLGCAEVERDVGGHTKAEKVGHGKWVGVCEAPVPQGGRRNECCCVGCRIDRLLERGG